MKAISKSELAELTQSEIGLCVSLYLPTHRHYPGTDEDPIRLKNLIRQAEQYLIDAGLGSAKCTEFLGPVRALVDDVLFWRYQKDGLAIFIREGRIRLYPMALRVPELAIVAYRFYLKPLLSSLARDRRFFALSLSLSHSRLFQASTESLAEITPDGFPEGLSAIAQQYEVVKSLQFRSGVGTRTVGRAPIFHGQGGRSDELKLRIVEYLREINRCVMRELTGERSPLVLVGVDYLLAMYREVNTYGYLLDVGISGSSEAGSLQEIRQKSRAISERLFEASLRGATDKYCALTNTDRASNDLGKILNAANTGRIETLFVPLDTQPQRKVEPESSNVKNHQGDLPDIDYLADQLVVQTFLSGGEVLAVCPADVPGGGVLAAIFRY